MKIKTLSPWCRQYYFYYSAFFFVLFFFIPLFGYGQCSTWYKDNDGDGFGNPAITQVSCSSLTGYVLNHLDCNDAFFNTAIRKSIGGGGFSTGATVTTKIDIGSDGLPVVLYQNYTSGGQINSVAVSKFNGTSWVTLGTDPISTVYDMVYPKMTLDQNGVAYISFTDFQSSGSSDNKVTILKYNSTLNTWELVGPRRFSGEVYNDTRIELKFDNSGVLYAAFLDEFSNTVVMKFDSGSNSWQLVGSAGFAVATTELSLAFDGANIPYIAFADANQSNMATVMKYDGTNWINVGSPGFSDYDIDNPKIDLNSANVPYVAYYDYGANEVIVQKFISGAWQKVGNTPVEAGTGASVSLAIDLLDIPIVAYQASPTLIKLKKLDASNNWVNIASTVNQGLNVDMVIGPDNIPYVAFKNLSDGDKATAQSVAPLVVVPTAPTVSAVPATICAGDNTTLKITAGTLNDGTHWTWYAGGCGSGASVGTGTSLSVAPSTTTTYYARGEGNCTTSVGPCSTLTVTVDQKPLVAGARSVQFLAGGSTVLTSDPGHPTYSYQWQLNTGAGVFNPIANGGIYSGASTVGITINPLDATLNGYVYRNRIVNGTCTVYDGAVTIYVTDMPTSAVTCSGGNTSFSVLTSNGDMTYQWQEDTGSGFSNISNGGVYSGATSRELVIIGAVLAMDSYKYRVKITDASNNTVTSNGLANLTINTPSTITAQPTASQNLCVGSALNLSVTATGTGLTYQWKKNGTDIVGATSNSYSIGSVSTTDAATYTVSVTTSGVCTPSSVLSSSAVVAVNTPSTITAQPTASQNLCVGSALNLSVTATGTSLTYQWKKDGTDIIGATSNSYSIASISTTDAATYTVAVTTSGVCTPSSVLSSNAVVTVNTPSTITSQPTTSQNLCVGSALSLSVTATGTGLTYQWKKNGTDISGATGNSYSIASVSTTDAATYTVAVTTNGVCTPSIVLSGNAVVGVNTPSTITAQPTASQNLCVGSALNLSVTATGTGLTYQWKKNGTDIVGATGSSYSIASVSTTEAATYTVAVTTSGVCTPSSVLSGNAVVTVSTPSAITAQPTASQNLCVGSTLNLSVAAIGTGLTYQWKKNGTDISGATGNSYSVAGVSTTDAATYTVAVATSGVCTPSIVLSGNAVVGVNTPSTITAQPTVSQNLCVGSTLNLGVTATGTGLTYQWKKNGTDIAGATNNSYSIASVSTTDAATYTVSVTTSGVCTPSSVLSGNAVVSVNAPSTITAQPTASQNLCVGSTLNLGVTATGTGLTYQWKKNGTDIAGATGNSYSIASVSTTDAATYTVAVATSGVCTPSSVLSGNAVVSVNTPSTITAQPTASQNLCVGSTLNLSVTATGTGLTYQWKKNGTDIVGATSNSCSIASVSTTDAATYTVAVTTSGVCMPSSVLSGNAVVTVNTPSTITAQPTASQNLCVGSALNLSVIATGTGLTYQWKKNGTDIVGGTSNSYSIASVSATDAATYMVSVATSGVCIPSSVLSSNAVVSVNTPSTITAQPTASQNLCVGSTLNLSVTATGTGLTYQWKKNGTDIAGATSNSYSVASVSATDAATYMVSVATSGVCIPSSVLSSNAVVSVNTPSTITAQPTASQNLCVGSTLNLSVTATGTGLTYQWKKNGTDIAGATSNSYSVASVSATDAATYTVSVTTSGVCTPSSVLSGNAVVSISTSAGITTQPAPSQTLCIGEPLNLSVMAIGTGIGYQWRKNGTDITGAIGNSYYVASIGTADAGTYSVVVTSTSSCASSGITSNDAIVNVNTIPSITAQPTASQNLCVGSALNLSVTATGTSLTYQWKKNGTDIVGATSNSYSIASVSTTDAATYTVAAITSGVCTPSSALSSNAVVTVNTPSTITAQPTTSQNLCVGNALNLSVTAAGTSLTYQWKKNGTDIVGATSNSYSIASVSTTDAATYTVAVITSGVCTPSSVVSSNAVVTVNTPSAITAQLTASQNLCVGSALNLSVTATGTGLTYQWKKNGTDVAGATSNSYSVASVSATDAATYTVSVTTSGVCTPSSVLSSDAVVTVNTPSTITAQPTASQNLCVGSALNLSVTATGTSLTYQWKKDGTDIIGATSNSYSIASISTTDAATYTVAVTTSGVCTPSSVLSSNAVVTVNTPSTITSQPTTSQNLCVGSALSLSVTATGTGLTYQWKKNGTDIVGATGNSYSIASVSTTDAATYTVAVTTNGVCTPSSVLSGNAVVTVNTPSTITAQPTASQNLCIGSTLSLSVTATGTGLTYQWKKSGTDIIGATSNSYSIASVSTTDAATYAVAVITSGVCTPSSVLSSNAVVTVNTPSAITAQPIASQNLCVGSALNLSVAATGTGLTYQWKKNGTDIVGATSNSYSIASVSTTDAATYIVSVTTSGVCTPSSVLSGNAVVQVNVAPTITTQPIDATVCAGANAIFTITATGTNLTYQWQEDAGAGFTNITNTGVYSGVTSASLHITVVPASMNAHKFRVLISNIGCNSTTSNGNARLLINLIQSITTQPVDQVVCEGKSAEFSVLSNNGSLSYQWQADDGSGFKNISNSGVYSGATTNSLLISTTNQLMNKNKYRVTVKGTCVDELSNVAMLSVNLSPDVSAGPDKTIELGESVRLDGAASGDSPLQYQWTPVNDTIQAAILQPTVSPVSDTEYTLVVISTYGCSATDAMLVKVLKQMVIPNAFSPNNDAINDTWKIENLDPSVAISVQVFNRYGQSVFTSNKNPIAWDGTYQGKLLPWGTYYYIIELEHSGKPISGWVVILN